MQNEQGAALADASSSDVPVTGYKDEPDAQPPAVKEPGAIVPMTDAEAAFREHAQMRDEVLSTPFCNNRTMAKLGTGFTILRVLANKWNEADPLAKPPKPEREQLCYLIALEEGYLHEDESNPAGDKIFERGAHLILALDRNRVRDTDKDFIRGLIEDHGALPHMALQQYPAVKAGMSPSHGIVAKRDWKPLRDLVAARNGATTHPPQ